MKCCQYIELTICSGEPASPPLLIASTKQIAILSITTPKYIKYEDVLGTDWCFELDPDATPVCEIPSGAILLDLHGVTLYTDCPTCDAGGSHTGPGLQTGGGPGSGGSGGCNCCVPGECRPPCSCVPDGNVSGGTNKYYLGMPCDGLTHPVIWGTPSVGLVNGTYIEVVGTVCYTFTVDGTGTTSPPLGLRYIFITNVGPSNCSACTFGVPCYACAESPLSGTFKLPYVESLIVPDHSSLRTWPWNGVCIVYDPSASQVIIPAGSPRVVPPSIDPFPGGCSDCGSGFLASLCPGQEQANLAPQLWIRRAYQLLSLVIDVFKNSDGKWNYIIDPSVSDTPKPPDAIEWVPKGDFSDCDTKCNNPAQIMGIKWTPCPNDPKAGQALPRYTTQGILPAGPVTRVIAGICQSLNPNDPLQPVPEGEGAIIPQNDYPDGCLDCVNSQNPDGPNGPGGPGRPPGGPGTNGDGGGNDGGTPPDPTNPPPNNDPRPFRDLTNCDDPTDHRSVDRRTLGYIETGYTIKSGGVCYQIVGNPQLTSNYPLISGTVHVSCSACENNTKNCFTKWQIVYDCSMSTWGTPFAILVTCSDPADITDPINTWIIDPSDLTGNTWYIWSENGGCSVTDDCVTGDTPGTTPSDTPICCDCATISSCQCTFCLEFTQDDNDGCSYPLTYPKFYETNECTGTFGGVPEYSGNIGKVGSHWEWSDEINYFVSVDSDCPPTNPAQWTRQDGNTWSLTGITVGSVCCVDPDPDLLPVAVTIDIGDVTVNVAPAYGGDCPELFSHPASADLSGTSYFSSDVGRWIQDIGGAFSFLVDASVFWSSAHCRWACTISACSTAGCGSSISLIVYGSGSPDDPTGVYSAYPFSLNAGPNCGDTNPCCAGCYWGGSITISA